MRRPDSGIILVSECSEARMLARSALLGLSFFSILCPALIAAPQAPEGSGAAAPPQGSFVIRSTSRLVQVRVVVQDTKGEPITGLKSEDFTVLDEGRPQNIAVFSAETPVLPKPAHPLPNNFFTNRFDLKGQDPGSVTVILFDALNTSGPDLIYVRKHILNFLQTLKPQDRVAIYALTTQLVVLHEFTQDISALVSAASHFVPHESAGYDASNTEKVDLVGMTGDVDWLGFQNALNNANGMISDQSAINRAGTTSAAIEAIADHVATIPGPKSLIWVSAGFPIQIGTATIGRTDMANLTAGSGHDPRTSLGMGQHSPVGGGDATNELNRADREYESLEPVVNRAALALNRANMAIYPVDARGVELEPTTSSDKRSATTAQDTSSLTKEQESRDSSKLLADRTGGLAYFGSNNLGDAMHRAMDDGRHGYTIGFYPDHGKWNGKFREIKIRVKVDGARLRYRKGYIALAYHVASSKDIDTALQETAVSPLEATTLGMIVEGKLIEPLSAHNLQLRIGIDPKQLLLQDSHSHQKGSVDLLFVQRDSAGEILSAEKQHLDLNLPQAQYEFLAKAGMVLEHHMTINPQASEIRIVVSDAGSGALGSVTIPGKPFFETKTTPVAP
jgi:VWFA-related protein